MVFSRISIVSLLLITTVILSGCNTGFGRSNNNNLESLSLEGNSTALALTPAFSSDETSYTRTVGKNIEEISVTAKAEDELATMTLQGSTLENNVARTVALIEGENRIEVVVRAENERRKTYTINVTRLSTVSTDADISDLEILNTDFESFSSSTDTYNISLTGLHGGLEFFATFDDEANANIDGVSLTNGTPLDFLLDGRDSPIEISVTAGDLTTQQTYSFDFSLPTSSEFSGKIYRKDNLGNLDDLGAAIALSDRYLAVGAPGEDGADKTLNGGASIDSGAVIVYKRNAVGEDFIESDENIAVLKAETATESVEAILNARFGHALDISEEFIVVGAPGNIDLDSNDIQVAGKVYIYKLVGSEWQFEALLEADENNTIRNGFGYSLSISDNLLVVGAPGINKAYVYEYQENEWKRKAVLSSPATGTSFGKAVSANYRRSNAGNTLEIVVGDPGSESIAGAAYFYRKLETASNWPETGVEIDSGPAHTGNFFGASISLRANTLVVGAPGDDSLGNSVVEVPETKLGDQQTGRGAVFIFNRNGNNWDMNEFYLKPPGVGNDTDADDAREFGKSIATDAGVIVIGFSRDGSADFDEDSNSDVFFSSETSDRADDVSQSDSGGVFLFTGLNSDSQNWDYRGMFKAKAAETTEQFGFSVYLHKGEMAVGAPKENGSDQEGSTPVGAAYIVR